MGPHPTGMMGGGSRRVGAGERLAAGSGPGGSSTLALRDASRSQGGQGVLNLICISPFATRQQRPPFVSLRRACGPLPERAQRVCPLRRIYCTAAADLIISMPGTIARAQCAGVGSAGRSWNMRRRGGARAGGCWEARRLPAACMPGLPRHGGANGRNPGWGRPGGNEQTSRRPTARRPDDRRSQSRARSSDGRFWPGRPAPRVRAARSLLRPTASRMGAPSDEEPGTHAGHRREARPGPQARPVPDSCLEPYCGNWITLCA